MTEPIDAKPSRFSCALTPGLRPLMHEEADPIKDLVLYGSADQAVCDRLWTLFQESWLPFSVDVVSYAAIDSPPLRAHIDAVARPLFVRTDTGLVAVEEA